MTERADQPAAPEIPHGVPGKALAAQREAMGWTVEQVADQLKLAVRQVVALEAGDYAALPSPAVVRGFVRAYAKILRLDAAPLVAMIELETPAPAETGAQQHRPQKPATFSESRFPSHGKRGGAPLGWIAAAVALAAAGAAAWHFGLVPGATGDATTGAEQAASTTVLNTPESASATAPAAEPVQNPNVPLISVPSATAEATPPAAVPAATAPGDAGQAVVAPVTAAPAAAAAPAPGANALVLTVREDSWIEVRPAKGGAALVSRLAKAGSTETVEVTEPVNVVVGKPSGVSATLRGAPVELPPVPGKTISRVSLK